MNTYYSDDGAADLLKENFFALSGWDVDSVGGELYIRAHECFVITLNKLRRPVVLKKVLKEVKSGVVTLETACRLYGGANVTFRLFGREGETFSLTVENGRIHSKGHQFCECLENVPYRLRAEIDLQRGNAAISVNGAVRGNVFVECHSIRSIEVIAEGEEDSRLFLPFIEMYRGFYVHERFSSCAEEVLPPDWEVKSSYESRACVRYLEGYDNIDSHALLIEDGRRAALPTVVYKKFASEAEETFCAELKCYFPYPGSGKQGIDISLCSEANAVITLHSDRTGLHYGNQCLRKCSADVWQHIKVIGNVKKNEYTILLNGKEAAKTEAAHAGCKIDGIKIQTCSMAWTRCLIAEVFAYPVMPLPEKYPSKPKKADTDGVHIGVQTCNLWYEGDNAGWDLIESYPERKPYLGYYYDGLSETRDWEIKWMAEHGIEFFMPCWYLPDGYKGGAFFKDLPEVMESYFNSQYKGYLKFAIQFTGIAPNMTSECFRKYVVPYWIEYFFKDPNYMVVDNKPLIAFSFAAGLDRLFGSTSKAAEELEYLREECKKIGFDGAYIIGGEQHRTEIHLKKTDGLGFDAIFSYTWGPCSENADRQRAILLSQAQNSKTDVIATVSQGYDESAWRGRKLGGYIAPENFRDLLRWVKLDFMTAAAENSLRSKLLLLDNWNEYGEGHFIMPSELHGFAYLDSIREVFCGECEHTDERPDDEQKERLEALWPANRRVLKNVKSDSAVPNKILRGWYFDRESDNLLWQPMQQIDNLHIKNGVLCGTATGTQPVLLLSELCPFSGLQSPYVRFDIRLTDVYTMLFKLYFITESDKEWNEAKSFSGFVCEADFENIYVCTERNSKWRDNIIGLRLQPMSSEGQFEIRSFEILEYDEQPMRWQFGERTDRFFSEPFFVNECLLAPVNELPKELDLRQSWESEGNFIQIFAGGKRFEFPLGKNEVTVNGKKEKIGAGAQIKERVAYIPIEYLFGKAGIKHCYSEKEKLFRILV